MTEIAPSRQFVNPFVVEFISATDIPLYDGKSKSDPYLQAYISSHVESMDINNRKVFQLQRISNLVQTPRRLDCTSVLWHCYRDLNVKPTTEAMLTVELYHYHREAARSILLGKIDIPVERLIGEEPIKFPLYAVKGAPQGKNPDFSVTLRRVFGSESVPLYRTFFMIRHGESKWNEAQAKINITGMLDKDHALTEDGINQACALNARWRLVLSQGKGKYAEITGRRRNQCSELIDFSRLGDEDLVADGVDSGSDSESEAVGASKEPRQHRPPGAGTAKALGKLYDSFFQKYSNVTVAGKPRASQADSTGATTSSTTGSPTGPQTLPSLKVPGREASSKGSFVPSFLESEILDFSGEESPLPPNVQPHSVDLLDFEPAAPSFADSVVAPPTLPAVTDPFDLLDGYTEASVQPAATVSEVPSEDSTEDGEEEGEDADLSQRREEYIRLFLLVDVVYTSPLTRAVQTALAAMCTHPALIKNKLTLYSIIREIKRIGGLDTVGIECGAGIMRRVKAELQLAMGVARAHEITDFVKTDVNDANTPWWTSVSSFENDRDQLERVREFITYSRYCPHNLPVFVGHSLFFKAFCSKRISAVMSRKRPHLSANLKRYRLSNATLLAVTVRYFDLDNGCSEAVILDADLLFGGGFHGVHHADHRSSAVQQCGGIATTEKSGSGSRGDTDDIDGSLQLPPPSQASRFSSSLGHTINHKVGSNLRSGSQAIGKRISSFFDK